MSLTSRPAAAAAVTFGCGIAARKAGWPAEVDAAALVALTASLVLSLLVAHVVVTRRRDHAILQFRRLHAAAAIVLIFASGYSAYDAARAQRQRLIATIADSRSTQATVVSPVQRFAWGVRFDVRPKKQTGRVRVTLTGDAFRRWSGTVEPGSSIAIGGPIDVAISKRNPADFDYGAWLFVRGVSCAVTIDDPDAIDVQRDSLAAEPRLGRMRRLADQTRSLLIAEIDARVNGRSRAVIRAMLVGDRSELDNTTRDALARAGLMHLLAVSGLHVMLVGFVWYRMAAPILTRLGFAWIAVEWLRALSTLAILCMYAAVTGGSPSVVRAVVMGGLLMGQALAKRRADTLNTLGVAALILLATWPPSLFDVGFQLSFAAVASIVGVATPAARLVARRRRHPGFLASSIGVSVAATLGTAPIVAKAFGFVPLAGILLNVVAVPLAATTLGSSILMLLAAGLSDTVASMFARTSDWSARLILEIGVFADRELAFASIDTASAHLAFVVVSVVAVTAIVHLPRMHGRWRWTTAGILCIAVATFGDSMSVAAASETLDVVFLDVGQGDAAIIRTPGRRFVLVDAGPPGDTSPAAQSIVPLLRKLGARRIALLAVSHPHADHDGGVDDVSSRYAIGIAVGNGLLDRIGETHAFRGMTIEIDEDVQATVLSPPNYWPRDRPIDQIANNHSLVLRIDFRETCFLFTGDIESEAEAFLGSTRDRMDCEVVKVAHHGSRTSSTWPLVSATQITDPVSAGFAVISAGRGNRFGHPHAEVVNRWRESGRRVLTTVDGAQWLRSDGRHVWVHDWR